jgi:type IV secretion system protein TrbL
VPGPQVSKEEGSDVNDLNVIDRFLAAFVAYIDSGFGLLGGDVGFLTSALIGIDVTLAGLLWALGGADDILARFLRKILYIGAFAFLLNSFSTLSDIIFRSFAQAGLTAGGGTLSADDLLRPGRLAGTGFEAAAPLLDQVSDMVGPVAFFENFVPILVLVIAWAVVITAFFILAVQLFVTILEFKLTSLAGFILVPFALWNRTSFLAERVLGSVITSGIKVMVLAVIVGIGSNYFAEFTAAIGTAEADIDQAVSLMLASLALFGLGIFGPSVASGLVAGAPQLGAGSAVATTALAAGGVAAVAGVGGAAARGIAQGGLGAIRAGTAMGAASAAAWQLGQESAGQTSMDAGMRGLASAARGAIAGRADAVLGLRAAAERGRAGMMEEGASSPAGASTGAPDWARRLRAEQAARHHRQLAVHTLRDGDRGGASATPDIKERD